MKQKSNIFVALKPFNNRIFYRNGIFANNVGVSGTLFPRLRESLERRKIYLNTIDIELGDKHKKIIFLDVPYPWEMKQWLSVLANRKNPILFMWEEPVVNPFNYMETCHRFFKRIYTWNDDIVDNKRFFKFYLPKTSDGIDTDEIPYRKKSILTFIGSNLSVFPPFRFFTDTHELYSERARAVGFFEQHAKNDFCFYGRGWNTPQRFSITQRIFGYKRFASYKGAIPTYKEKLETLSKFKFCLCFENSAINGGVTEKIIDCFKAKCVPIYLGAPNIEKYVPKGCYIDARRFANYDELLTFVRSIREDEYTRYVENAKLLLANRTFQRMWFEEGFIETVVNALREN